VTLVPIDIQAWVSTTALSRQPRYFMIFWVKKVFVFPLNFSTKSVLEHSIQLRVSRLCLGQAFLFATSGKIFKRWSLSSATHLHPPPHHSSAGGKLIEKHWCSDMISITIFLSPDKYFQPGIIFLLLSRIDQINYWQLFSKAHKHYRCLQRILKQKLFTKVIQMPCFKPSVERSWV
jgi:hypothetical protein